MVGPGHWDKVCGKYPKGDARPASSPRRSPCLGPNGNRNGQSASYCQCTREREKGGTSLEWDGTTNNFLTLLGKEKANLQIALILQTEKSISHFSYHY